VVSHLIFALTLICEGPPVGLEESSRRLEEMLRAFGISVVGGEQQKKQRVR
jgi:hypothetical protein